jgi:hypothetical protein
MLVHQNYGDDFSEIFILLNPIKLPDGDYQSDILRKDDYSGHNGFSPQDSGVYIMKNELIYKYSDDETEYDYEDFTFKYMDNYQSASPDRRYIAMIFEV